MNAMDIALNAVARRRGALLPLVMLVSTVYWGIRPWTVLVIAVGAAVALLAPSVAAGLAAITLIGFASCAFALFLRASTYPPGSSSLRQYPLHALVFGVGVPHAVDLTAGLVMLACGVWLVPRTIGGRTALARRNRELIGRVRRLTVARVEAVDSAAAELRRVERDLHDGAQARLIALGISLRATERLIRTDPDAAVALVAAARDNSARALAELRALVSGIHPPVLAERGLADALRALALDSPLPTATDIDLPGRLPAPVQAAAYFAVAEALANAAKHASARSVHIRAAHSAGALRIEVSDDGAGGADPAHGTGLRGIERRLGTFDGVLAVSSPPGGPTIVVIEVPCASSSPKTFFLLREGLASLLKEHGFEIAEAVGDGPSLLRALLEHRPDVAIVDVRLPPAYTDEGLRAALDARRQVPGLPTLILSTHVEQLYARELLADQAGGVGYLLKDRVFTDEQFTDAMRTVARGGTVMDPEVVGEAAGPAIQPAAGDPAQPAGTCGPRAAGRGPVQQRDRAPPGHLGEGGQQALHQHLRQAGAAPVRGRQPPGAGRAGLPGPLTSATRRRCRGC